MKTLISILEVFFVIALGSCTVLFIFNMCLVGFNKIMKNVNKVMIKKTEQLKSAL